MSNNALRNAKQILSLWRNSIRERYVLVAIEIAQKEQDTGERAPDELYAKYDQLKGDYLRASDAIESVPDM